jgi:hypothetical protein
MIEYFKQIDIDFTDIDFTDLSTGQVIHNPRKLDFNYYSIKDEYIQVLTNLLPEEYRTKLQKIVYIIAGGPATYYPHRDNVGVNAINHYIITGDSETSFYEPIVQSPRYVTIDNVEYTGWYDYEDLSKIVSFNAQVDETFILNINKIHDLKVFEGSPKRHILQYIFDQPL